MMTASPEASVQGVGGASRLTAHPHTQIRTCKDRRLQLIPRLGQAQFSLRACRGAAITPDQSGSARNIDTVS
eukprot:13117762-Alexandrium_andersonii.AAC.1